MNLRRWVLMTKATGIHANEVQIDGGDRERKKNV